MQAAAMSESRTSYSVPFKFTLCSLFFGQLAAWPRHCHLISWSRLVQVDRPSESESRPGPGADSESDSESLAVPVEHILRQNYSFDSARVQVGTTSACGEGIFFVLNSLSLQWQFVFFLASRLGQSLAQPPPPGTGTHSLQAQVSSSASGRSS